jgi:hypothetical protein
MTSDARGTAGRAEKTGAYRPGGNLTRMRCSRPAALALPVALVLALAGCDDGVIAPGDAGVGDAASYDGGADALPVPAYTVVVLPDTQYYASSWPDIFMAQTRWIAENQTARQIAFVLHTGDLVDSDVPEQWTVAAQAMHALDGLVPYVVTAGNHDYFENRVADRVGMGSIYFPPAQFAPFPWFRGTYEADHIENSFSLVDVPGGRWLILALEFGPRDEVVAWANQILTAHRESPAILITHAYLYRDGTRYDHLGAPGQSFNPHEYVMMDHAGSSINDGAELWTKLVEPNSNVKLVLSGHDVNGGGIPPGTAARLTSTRADGTIVQQLLANYQSCLGPPCESLQGRSVHGGNGFLRLLHFPAAGHTVTVETYSPYLDQSLSDAANQFTIEVP